MTSHWQALPVRASGNHTEGTKKAHNAVPTYKMPVMIKKRSKRVSSHVLSSSSTSTPTSRIAVTCAVTAILLLCVQTIYVRVFTQHNDTYAVVQRTLRAAFNRNNNYHNNNVDWGHDVPPTCPSKESLEINDPPMGLSYENRGVPCYLSSTAPDALFIFDGEILHDYCYAYSTKGGRVYGGGDKVSVHKLLSSLPPAAFTLLCASSFCNCPYDDVCLTGWFTSHDSNKCKHKERQHTSHSGDTTTNSRGNNGGGDDNKNRHTKRLPIAEREDGEGGGSNGSGGDVMGDATTLTQATVPATKRLRK